MEEHEDTDQVLQNEILSKQFLDIQFVKPRHLTSKQECLFRFASSMIHISSKYMVVQRIFMFLRFFQHIFITSFLELTYCKNRDRVTIYQEVLSFVFQQPQQQPNLLLCVICFCLGVFCIFLYFYGLYCSSKHIILSNTILYIIYIVTVEVVNFILFILISQTSNLFGQLILGDYLHFMPQFAIQSVVLLVLLFINGAHHDTIYNSQFYLSGTYAKLSSPNVLSNSFLVILYVVSFAVKITDPKLHYRALGSLYIGYGVFFVLKGFVSYFMHNEMNAYVCSFGVTFIAAGIQSILHGLELTKEVEIYLYSLLIIFFVFYFVFYAIFALIAKMQAKRLAACGVNFDSLNIRSVWHLTMMFRSGFAYGVKTALNGQFLEWATQHFNIRDLEILMIRYASLFKNPPLYMSILDSNFRETPRRRSNQFIIYEYDLINDMRSVTKLKPEYQEAIQNVSNKICLFPSLSQLYAKSLTNSPTNSFYLIQGMHHMRNIIISFVWEMKHRFPNNILVIKMCILYEMYITRDKENLGLLKYYKTQLENDNEAYIDKFFTIPLTKFTRAHGLIMDLDDTDIKSQSDENSYTEAEEKYAKMHTIQKRFEIYNHRTLIIWLLLCSVGVSIFTIFLTNYIICYNQTNQNDNFTNLQFAFLDFASYFFKNMVTVIPVATGNMAFNTTNCLCKDPELFYKLRGQFSHLILTEPFESDICLNRYTARTNFAIETPIFHSNDTIIMPFHIFTDQIYTIIRDKLSDANGEAVSEDWIIYFVDSFAVLAQQIADGGAVMSDDASADYLSCYEKQAQTKIQYSYYAFAGLSGMTIIYFICCFFYAIYVIRVFTENLPSSRIIYVYLSKAHPNLTNTLLKIAGYYIIVVACVVASYFIDYELYAYSSKGFKNLVQNTISTTRSVFYAFNAVNSFELYNYTNYSNYVNQSTLVGYVNRSLNFFFGNTNTETLKLSNIDLDLSLFELAVLNNSTPNKLISTNETTTQIRTLFMDYLVPSLVDQEKNNTLERIETSEVQLVFHSFVGELLYCTVILTFWLFFFAMIDFFDLTTELKELIKIYVESSENKINAVDPIDAWKNKTSAQFVLETLLNPTCLTSSEGIIITVNSYWCNFFQKQMDEFIGADVEDFIKDIIDKLNIISVQDYKLYVLEEQIEERKVSMKLEKLKDMIISYRCDVGPKRFANWRNINYELDFVAVVNASIYIKPEGDEEILMAADEMITNLLERKIRVLADFDIIRSSARQITIIFGVNKQLTNFQIISQAVTLAIDFCMSVASNECRDFAMTPTCVISCGNATFNMTEDNLGTIDISGVAICDASVLQQYAQQGSVTVSKMVVQELEKSGFQHDFVKILDNVYEMFVDSTLQ